MSAAALGCDTVKYQTLRPQTEGCVGCVDFHAKSHPTHLTCATTNWEAPLVPPPKLSSLFKHPRNSSPISFWSCVLQKALIIKIAALHQLYVNELRRTQAHQCRVSGEAWLAGDVVRLSYFPVQHVLYITHPRCQIGRRCSHLHRLGQSSPAFTNGSSSHRDSQ